MNAIASPLLIAAAAVGLGTVLDVIVKTAGASYALVPLLFWRYMLAGLVLAGVYGLKGKKPLNWPGTRFHILRGIVHLAAASFFFQGLILVPLAEATVLGFLAVLFIPFMARLFLGEHIRALALLAAGIGFVGISIIASGEVGVDANPDRILEGRLYCLIASVFYAGSLVMLRKRAQVDDGLTVAVYGNLIPGLWLMVPVLFFMDPLPLYAAPWVLLFATIGTGVWVLMAWAYRLAPAAQIGPLEYSSLLWAALFGYVIFDEIPSAEVWLGAAFIIGACFLLILDERRRTKP